MKFQSLFRNLLPRKTTSRSMTISIIVVIRRLIDGHRNFSTIEEQLAIEAIRRSSHRLENASLDEIADFVAGLSPEQARGFINNIKGIYHELLFAHLENTDGDGISARVAEMTNQPGWDVEFSSNGEVIRQVQLKATNDPAYLLEHLERYPDIDLYATSEVASGDPLASSTGISNEALESQLRDVMGELEPPSFLEGIVYGTATALLVSASLQAAGILSGKRQFSVQAFEGTLKELAIGSGTAALLDLVL